MEKQEVIFTDSQPKKHSVRFTCLDKSAAISDVYIKRTALGSSGVPKKVKITIEEVS